jgi:hypothetical protein
MFGMRRREFMHLLGRRGGWAAGASRVARSIEASARERQLQCLCFADREQEHDKQTGLGRTW